MLYGSDTLAAFQTKLVIGPTICPKPSEDVVTAAAHAVGVILLQGGPVHSEKQTTSQGVQNVYFADDIINALAGCNHTRPASAWAVFELIQRGCLDGELIVASLKVIRIDNDAVTYDIAELCPPAAQYLVGPTESGKYIAGPTRTGDLIVGPRPIGDHLVVPNPPHSHVGGLVELPLHGQFDFLQARLGIWPTQHFEKWFYRDSSVTPRTTEPPIQASPFERVSGQVANSQEAVTESTWPKPKGWDFRPGEAVFNGTVFRVVGKEADVLNYFVACRGNVVAVKDLRVAVWAGDALIDDKTIRAMVSTLRTTICTALDLDPKDKAKNPILSCGHGTSAYKLTLR